LREDGCNDDRPSNPANVDGGAEFAVQTADGLCHIYGCWRAFQNTCGPTTARRADQALDITDTALNVMAALAITERSARSPRLPKHLPFKINTLQPNAAFGPKSPCQHGTRKTRNCVLPRRVLQKQDIPFMNSRFQTSIETGGHSPACTAAAGPFNFAQTKPLYGILIPSPPRPCTELASFIQTPPAKWVRLFRSFV